MNPNSPLQRFLFHPDTTVSALLHQLAHAAAAVGTRFGPFVGASLLVALAVRSLLLRWEGRRLLRGARFVAILIPPEVGAACAVAFWSTLIGLLRPRWRRAFLGQPHVAFEYTWSADGVRIGLWVPGTIPPGFVEQHVEAAWPGCRTVTGAPEPPVPPGGLAAGGALRLADREWFPLRTDHEDDPLRPLLGAARDFELGDAAAVQILVRPVTGVRARRGLRAAKSMRQGRPMTLARHLVDLALPGPPRRAPAPAHPAQAPDVRAILTKAANPAFEVAVRYAVATDATTPHAKRRLRGRAHALASAFAIYTGRNGLRRRRLRRPAAVLAARRLGRGDLLSVPELAALAHLPFDVAVPGLARAGARAVAPPPAVGSTGKVLGDAQSGQRRRVALAAEDARYHLHVMGGTGSGKSTLLLNLVLADAEARRGAVVIDPAGDLVLDILDRLPTHAAGRTVVIDAEDPHQPPSLNPLEGPDIDVVVDNVVGIFARIFQQFWGPRTDDVLRSACLTLLRRPGGATLIDVPRLLSEPVFRQQYTLDIDDPAGIGGFWSWYDAASPALQSQVIGPVMNKLRAFLLRDFARKVIGESRSSFDMGRVLDGGLCLVRIPKALGEETSRLLGSFVIAKVWQAAMQRTSLPPAARRPAALYVDEAHNFLNLPRAFDEQLAEARKYNLSLVLAHQNVGQLPPRLREAISANARNKAFFTMSPEDATELERHVFPVLSAHDLAHLGAYQAAVRLVANGEEQPACTVATLVAPDPIPGRAELIRRRSRELYAGAPRSQPRANKGVGQATTAPDDPDAPKPLPTSLPRGSAGTTPTLEDA